jgi:glycosyltransferase involved in cell wall biosynthesis
VPPHRHKIAVLGVFANLDPAYSVAGVAAAHIRLLVSKGHSVVFITTDDFDGAGIPEEVEVRTYPRYQGSIPEGSTDPNFESYVFRNARAIAGHLSDVAVCLTHDVIFIRDYLPVNWAMRRANELSPGVRWLHWIHSAPSKRPAHLAYPLIGCYSEMSDSEIIYLHRTDVPRVAEMFDMPEARVRVVHNAVDPFEFGSSHPFAKELLTDIRYHEADTICIYPTRLTEAKQVDKLIKLMGSLKSHGQVVRLIVCNSYSNAAKEQATIGRLRKLASEWGLSESEAVFTASHSSRWAEETGYDLRLGVPRAAVFELLRISDLFVLPSMSEACSVVLLEAVLAKNLVVLNADLQSLYEFGGQVLDADASSRSIYYSFGSLMRPLVSYRPDEQSWYADHARALSEHQAREKALQFFKHVRKKHHPDWIYHNQLKPLLGSLELAATTV